MVNVKDKRCSFDGCNLYPSFNHIGQISGLYCVKHKEEKMVNVKNKKCIFNGCSTYPLYNYKNETTGIYCLKHKELNMVNVKSKKCAFKDCMLYPSFNYGGNTSGIYCSEHKESNMINVENKKCIFENCPISPRFNYPGELNGIYCFNHKEPNMINVKDKKCMECNITACYGFIGQSLSYCVTHKKSKMLTRPRHKCETNKCPNFATYGYRQNSVCEEHKENDMNCFVNTKCIQCNHVEIVNNEGYCDTCVSPDTFNKYQKAREKEIKHWLNVNNYKYDLYDKTIESGECFKYRPDFVMTPINKGFRVILEVDEDQHKNYCENGECTRMINLAQSFGGQPVVFIRYNPDSFVAKGRTYKLSFSHKTKVLKSWLEYILNKTISDIKKWGFVSMIQLFYDGFDEATTSYFTILGFDKPQYLIIKKKRVIKSTSKNYMIITKKRKINV